MIKNKNVIIKGKPASGKTTYALDFINQKPSDVHIFVYDVLGVYNDADVIMQKENENLMHFFNRVINIVNETVPRNHTSIIFIDHADDELNISNSEKLSHLQTIMAKMNQKDIFLYLLTQGVLLGHDLNSESFKLGITMSNIFNNFVIIEPFKSKAYCPKCGIHLMYRKVNGRKDEYDVICKNFLCSGFVVNATFNNLWTIDSEFYNYLGRNK